MLANQSEPLAPARVGTVHRPARSSFHPSSPSLSLRAGSRGWLCLERSAPSTGLERLGPRDGGRAREEDLHGQTRYSKVHSLFKAPGDAGGDDRGRRVAECLETH